MSNKLILGVLTASVLIPCVMIGHGGKMTPDERKTVFLKAQTETLNNALTVNALLKREFYKENCKDWVKCDKQGRGKRFILEQIINDVDR